MGGVDSTTCTRPAAAAAAAPAAADDTSSSASDANSFNVTCSEGHGDVICGVCTANYTRSKDKCIECPDVQSSALSLAAAFVVLYLFLLYNAFHTDGKDNESASTVLWRIFISYYTVCSTVGEFPIRGTRLFQDYISYFTRTRSSSPR